jgi:osmotically inducible lipoprotein OsmB
MVGPAPFFAHTPQPGLRHLFRSEDNMRKAGLVTLALAASVSLGGCSRYDDNSRLNSIGRGAAIGAAGGAAVGAVVDGVSTVEGAAAGAAVGAVVGAVTDSNREWRRDSRGDCYYVRDNRRVYDYDRDC